MQNIDNKKYLLETIGVLRFPLMVCVILRHIIIPNKESHLFVNVLDQFMIETFTSIAVPLFFLMSGFLFFGEKERFTMKEYSIRLKKRAIRLLVPYLIWGIIAVGIKYVFYKIGLEEADYLFEDGFRWVYHIIWRPLNFQLWFIRDLFFVVMISPIIYILVKKLRFLFVILLGVLWLFWHKSIFTLVGIEYCMWGENIFGIFGLDFVSLFFFSCGAYFALEKRDFTLDFKRAFPMAIVSYVVLLIVKFVVVSQYCAEILNRLAIVSGLMLVVVVVYELVRQGKVKRSMFLEKGSQFIYYYHILFLMYYVSLLKRFSLFDINNCLVYGLIYLSTPIITILLGLGLYQVGCRYMPKVMNFVLGLK